MKRNNTFVLLIAIATLGLTGCGSSGAMWTELSAPGSIEGAPRDGQYIVHVESGDDCTGPMVISEYLAVVQGGVIKQITRVSGANAAAGTCGMVITGIAKGLIPSVLGYLGTMDRNDAIREDTRARKEIAMNASGGPANLIVVENNIDVEIDQSKECGDKCF
jgi:hypothetical protein